MTYSYLRATSGSTFVARRAGSAHASTAAPSDTKTTIKYVAGSEAVTPNNMLDIHRVSANAPAKPIVVPITVSNIPLRITISRIPGLRAPSAMRMPISCVRNVIEYEITL